MKIKMTVLVLLLLTAAIASATTWYQNGILYGNVCRNGVYYTVYPVAMGQPVGTVCPIRDVYGNVVGTGLVSNE
jgi:hypothetical protein